jgi:hypothetical protein
VHEREVRAAARSRQLADAQRLDGAFSEEFLWAHLRDPPQAARPVVPEPAAVDEQAIERQYADEALRGVSWFKSAQRGRAREQARQQATSEAARQTQERQTQHDREQQLADDQWQKLLDNDPETVIATLEDTFEHDQIPAAGLDCTDQHATVLLRFPPTAGVVPAQEPALTPTGRPTMRERTQTQVIQLYATAVLSHSLAAGREALAACPGLREASVIVVTGGQDAASPVAPLAGMRIDRPTVERIDWSQRTDAAKVALSFERLLLIKGQTHELQPLSLVDQPEVRRVVDQVAQHLGVPVDDRCDTPLKAGQVQHFAPTQAGG